MSPIRGFRAAGRRDRRVQRQVHVEPDGAARRRGGDAGRPYPRDLSQFLPAGRALGVRRHSPGGGSHECAAGALRPSTISRRREESFRDAVLAGLVARAEVAALPLPLRRARLGAVRGDLRAARVLSDAHRDGDPRGQCRRDRRAGRARTARWSSSAAARAAKSRLLLDALAIAGAYVADRHLARAVCASGGDARGAISRICRSRRSAPTITRPLDLPPLPARGDGRRLGFFPGSTIGNFDARGGDRFPRRAAASCSGRGGALLVGVDLKKDPRAARRRLQRRAGRHRRVQPQSAATASTASSTPISTSTASRTTRSTTRPKGRIEIYIRSLADQIVTVAGRASASPPASASTPRIPTNTPIAEFQRLAARAGFRPLRHLDRRRRAVQHSPARRRLTRRGIAAIAGGRQRLRLQPRQPAPCREDFSAAQPPLCPVPSIHVFSCSVRALAVASATADARRRSRGCAQRDA